MKILRYLALTTILTALALCFSMTAFARPLSEWTTQELEARYNQLWDRYGQWDGGFGLRITGEPAREVGEIRQELWRRHTEPYIHPRVRGGEIFVVVPADRWGNRTIIPFRYQGPVNIDGRVLVPVRLPIESLGFEVEWDASASRVIIANSDYRIILSIGSEVFTTNEEEHILDVPAQIINGHTMVPLRHIVESVGMSAHWCSERQTVLILRADQEIQELPNLREFEQRVFELTNIERANHGLPALIWNENLASAALAHSTDMAVRGFFDHTSPDGIGPSARAREHGHARSAGENIYIGPQSPEEAVQGWMNSPGHRANILNPNWRYLGVGTFGIGEIGSWQGLYWTQKFSQ
jgi:uncharacterized protein YkwD